MKLEGKQCFTYIIKIFGAFGSGYDEVVGIILITEAPFYYHNQL